MRTCFIFMGSAGSAQQRAVKLAGMVLLLLVSLVSQAFLPEPARALTPVDSNKTYIVGGDYYYPPYEYLDEEGNPAGYNVELTRAIAEVMGLNIEIRLGNWSEMRTALEKGEVDVLPGTVFTEERQSVFDFVPHALIHQSIFYRKGSPSAKSVDDLVGFEAIVQEAGSMHDNLVKHGGITVILTDTHANALRLLASGKHDYAVVANLPGLYLGRKHRLSNIVTSGKTAVSFKYCYAVKKGNAELQARLNEGLSILKNTGRYQEIYDKWLGVLEPRTPSWTRIVKISMVVVVPLVLMMGAILMWNRTLKREVANRTRELHLQQQQLIQADKMASLGILVSGVAHEINNPNSLVLLNTPVIMDSFEDLWPILEGYYEQHGDFLVGGLEYTRMREEIPHMLSEMQAGGKRIKHIVEDLKDFSRIDNSRQMEVMDLNEVVRAAARLVDNSIKKATHCFSVSCSDSLCKVRGNPQRIEQVVVNLILNACQALSAPDQCIALKTFNSPDRKGVVLEVRDEGTGIDPDHLPHLTDPFFTTKRDTGGTGLGLSVSTTIVNEHGGVLDFVSEPGEGTTASLRLPMFRRTRP
ncbi:transporter substrate-binding domain-containing protein [Desulfoluna spongiiphila]|uniref:histidine kinase n=1 Tax=Desulfoluna spongiiphila TaxID=419481 RepID=A0A1G5J616_9BACT|nr:transporter substrate-binding domain-containing protein [Desulfoluna spongiiphila]SCY83269.1 amino acid-binding domain sensor histidine kinase [Desulfoluna spongiiphila]